MSEFEPLDPQRVSPRLRATVERIALDREGPAGPEPLLVLRDPLGLSEPLAIDRDLAGLLDLCDGTRTVAQIRQSMMMRGEARLDLQDLVEFFEELRAAGMLDDDEFRARWLEAHEEFMARPHRASWAAGLLFPGEREALESLLAAQLPDPASRITPGAKTLGVLCPHQPFERAGEVCAATLRDLPPADELDVVVILGTDHHPGMLPFALTDKGYDTPLGVARTDAALVARLDDRLGWARREEVRHRVGASIEFAAVMLRWIYAATGDGRVPPILPVLCGRSVLGADQDSHTDDFLAALELALEDRRVLFWATAELSHAGPAYGGAALDGAGLQFVKDHDQACLEPLLSGHTTRFRRRCLEEVPHGKPSGASALDVLVRLLPVGYRAELGGYTSASIGEGPAPGWVGMAGARFSRPDE